MVRRASADFQQWREMVLSSPWVKEVKGEVQCRAYAGYIPKSIRGDLGKMAPYRCQKRAKFKLTAYISRSMLTVDAVSGNYCPAHLMDAIRDHEGEAARFKRWEEKRNA
jgi:hypothetical protein